KQQLVYAKGLPAFDYSILQEKEQSALTASDITSSLGVDITHVENPFPEFSREPLLPHKLSTEGPALAVADIDHNGLEDIFIGSSKGEKSKLYLQQLSGKFVSYTAPALARDSMYEDVDACWVDVNNDGHVDLVVASGGNEYYGGDSMQLPRVYLNDGRANLTRAFDAFQKIFATTSCVAPYDFNGDGFVDLFIGGRDMPWEYGKAPRSYLLQNDGTGRFKDVTSKELGEAGFVTNAVWADMDRDGDKDLVLSLEWGNITAFENNKGNFSKKALTEKTGWWNFALPVDINNDGNLDLICGNLGLNSKLKASDQEPVRLYYNDFDGNGKNEQVMTYYLMNKEIPFANKAELEKQMPFLKKKFLYAEDFAKSSLKNMFGSDKLSDATMFTANYFSNAVLINKGNWQFEIKALPWQAQLTSYRDAVAVNANNDNLPDIFLAGNYYDNNIEMGR
ncbi:MAG TPA: VCBS repeat-containing protein, partial [Chitinophagaceae bacterium]|nr:VCBS repeat-containing protein [Chitinophagaceae bacterium]